MSYYYDGEKQEFRQEGAQPPRSQPPKKQQDNDLGSWLLIAILFAVGVWPIGLLMLIAKLSDSGKKRPAQKSSVRPSTTAQPRKKVTRTPSCSDKNARWMKVIGIILSVIGAVVLLNNAGNSLYWLSYDLPRFLQEIFYPMGILAGGVGLLLGSRGLKRRARRFGKYLSCAHGEEAVSLQHLAAAAEVSQRRVEKDLELMIEDGLWGKTAYVDLGRGMLFRSREAERDYDARNVRARVPEPEPQAEAGYAGVLRELRRANDRIDDPVLSAQIDRLEDVAGKIFRIIEREPAKKDKVSTFLNFYLPTTQKLLDSYAEFEEAGVSGENLNQAKEKIEGTMASIVAGFERQLDELYRTDAMDIDSDIRVMETMLRRDSASAAEDFGLGGSATATQPQEEK